MDLASVLASRRRLAESSVVTSEGLGNRVSDMKPSAEGARAALLAFGSQPPKADCGYVGLLNQGATCYLNSLLQVLFCTGDLRNALFEWAFSEDIHGEPHRSLTRQLQELFADLQLSARAAVSTGKLTRSFGWDGDQAFVQNDVHECMSVLMDALQTETFGSHVQDFIKSMHSGRMEHHTTCLGCHSVSIRPDEYKSLLLPVRGVHDMEHSLAAFLAEETLSGANQYACDVCACKQDAIRAPKLPADALPSTLFLQLNRFEFDYSTMTRKKVLDKVVPSLSLDLSPYVMYSDAHSATVDVTYELFAILMHNGAATAGHYFAYIRTPDAWLQFNDSIVARIADDQLQRALGQQVHATEPAASIPEGKGIGSLSDANKTREGAGGASSVPVHAQHQLLAQDAALGAYMLVYRRSSELRALWPSNSSACVPLDLAARIAAENDKYLSARREWEAEQRRARLRVYFSLASVSEFECKDSATVWNSDQLDAVDIIVADDASLNELNSSVAEAVSSALKAKLRDRSDECEAVWLSLVAAGCTRLRTYNALRGIALEPIEGTESRTLLKHFGLTSGKSLFVERRLPGSEWPQWLDGCLPVKITLFNPSTGLYYPPVAVLVPKSSLTVGTLRQLAAQACSNHAYEHGFLESPSQVANLRLILLREDSETPATVLADDAMHLQGASDNTLKINAGDVVHAELCPVEGEGADARSTVGSKVVTMWDQNVNTVSITFNVPDRMTVVNSTSSCSVQVDQRLDLVHLKMKIGEALSLDIGAFKVRRAAGGPEMKDLTQSLAYYGFMGGGTLFVELGRPLQPDEHEFRICFLTRSAAEKGDAPAYACVCTTALNATSLGTECKKSIADALAAIHVPDTLPFSEWPPPSHMRLREKPLNATKLGRVLVDDKPLAWNYNGKLNDGKELVVQLTAEPEHVSEGDLLLTLTRWCPLTSSLTRCPEAVFAATCTIQQFAKLAAARTGMAATPGTQVMLAKPWGWQLQDLTTLWHVKWTDVTLDELSDGGATTSGETLGKCRWNLKAGDTVLVVARNEFDDLTAPGKPEVKADDVSPATAAATGRAAGTEQGFKIYTRAEQIAREEVKKLDDERQKQENDERAAQLQAALDARKKELRDARPVDIEPVPAISGPPVPLAAPPGLERFVRLLQLGMSIDAVKNKMVIEGLDPESLPL